MPVEKNDIAPACSGGGPVTDEKIPSGDDSHDSGFCGDTMKTPLLFSLLSLAALAACGQQQAQPPNPCSRGICGSDDTSGTSEASGGPTTPGGGCAEAWSCSPWQKGADGMSTRQCTDANACGTTALRPPEGPLALPALDLDFYKCNVEPILDGGCAMLGCHGAEQGRALKIYARGRLRRKETVPQVASCPVGPQMVDLADEGSGTVMCIGWSPHTPGEWQENFDSARSFMIGLTDAEESDLLLQPMYGGKAHAGVHLFAKGDPDYETIKSWLGGAKLGSACDPGAN
jgi:hypothetical protein